MFGVDHLFPANKPAIYLAAYCMLMIGLLRLVFAAVRYLQEWTSLFRIPQDSKKGLQLPPGNMGYPIIGETFHFLLKGSQFYRQKMQKYGPIYKTHLLGKPTIRVIGAENVKKIVLGENDIVTQMWPSSTRLLLGGGSISMSSGDIHRVRRKQMLTVFSLDILYDFVPVLQEKICDVLEAWCQKRDILGYPECKRMALVAAARLMLGLEVDSKKGEELSWVFQDFLNNIMSIPFDMPGFGFHKGMNAKRRLIKELRRLLDHSKRHGSIIPTPVMDSYSCLCEKLGTDDEFEVLEGMLDLLYAGHETLASVTTSTLMLLGKHKEVVDKLRDELVDNNIACDSEKPIADLSYKKIDQLKYLGHVVKEILRLCPPAGGGFRKVLRDFELGGYLIPKDWVLIYSIRETQHTSPLYDESDQFLPERWEKLEENSDTYRFHFIPFGAGARGCLGKTYAMLLAKIFVIELVRRCDWSLKNPNPTMRYIPVPVATDHLPLTVTRRHPSD